MIAFVVVKLKIFGLLQHPQNGHLVGFYGQLLSRISFNLADIYRVFEKSFKLLNFTLNGTHFGGVWGQ